MSGGDGPEDANAVVPARGEELVTALTDARTAIDDAATAGTITTAQAAVAKHRLSAQITRLLDRSR